MSTKIYSKYVIMNPVLGFPSTVVVFLINIHGKQLWLCQEGQLTKPVSSCTGLDLLSGEQVQSVHCFASNRQQPCLKQHKR